MEACRFLLTAKAISGRAEKRQVREAASRRSPHRGEAAEARWRHGGPPRSVRCRSRSPGPAAMTSLTCLGWRRAESRTCTPARQDRRPGRLRDRRCRPHPAAHAAPGQRRRRNPDPPCPRTRPWTEGAAQSRSGASVALRRPGRAAQSRPFEAVGDRRQERSSPGRTPRRAHHDRARRADRDCPRHNGAEKILPPAGRQPARRPFPTPGHLAAYAGLAPVTRRSGISIPGEHPPKGGNKQLKRAFFLAAFASLAHPPSRAYYDRKRAQGKRHNAALICLARRRCDVLFAMLRDRRPSQPRPTEHALAA